MIIVLQIDYYYHIMSYQSASSYEERDKQNINNPAQLQKIYVNKFLKNLKDNYLMKINKFNTIGFVDSPIKQTEKILLKNMAPESYKFYSISRDFDNITILDNNHFACLLDDFILNHQEVKFNFFFFGESHFNTIIGTSFCN